MNRRLLALCLILLLLLAVLTACGGDGATAEDSPLLRMLRFVPDEPEYLSYLTFGDAVAWHESWDVPRIDSLEELEELDEISASRWLYVHSRQTVPPDSLAPTRVVAEDQRSYYGLDLFNMDRYLQAGPPPDWITVVEFGFDSDQIAEALRTSGYESEETAGEATLYSLAAADDYEMIMELPIQAAQLGNLNRIALLDQRVVIAKATPPVSAALAAQRGESPSLADNPTVRAAVAALQDPALADLGELVGVILTNDPAYGDVQQALPPDAPAELATPYDAMCSEGATLPPYTLVAFATFHEEGASFLTLAVVYPEGTDAESAAAVLADRMPDYVSVRTRRPIEQWSFETSAAVEAEGLPVALVVMRVDDPQVTEEGDLPTGVWSWIRMVVARDTLFLCPAP